MMYNFLQLLANAIFFWGGSESSSKSTIIRRSRGSNKCSYKKQHFFPLSYLLVWNAVQLTGRIPLPRAEHDRTHSQGSSQSPAAMPGRTGPHTEQFKYIMFFRSLRLWGRLKTWTFITFLSTEYFTHRWETIIYWWVLWIRENKIWLSQTSIWESTLLLLLFWKLTKVNIGRTRTYELGDLCENLSLHRK